MQKSTSTILIAFLAGLVVAGGSVYVVSTLRSKPAAPPPAVQTAAVQPVTQTASPAPVPPPESALAHEPAALAEPPAAVRPKPRPAVAKNSRRPSRLDDEASAAPQPTHAEVAQNTPPPAPVAAQTPEQAAHPAPALTAAAGNTNRSPPPREPKTVAIPAGTTFTVRVNETLSTETNYSGDTFTASLDKPLVVDGSVIADRGARVIGKITQAQKAGRVKGVSELALALTQIHTTDGQTVAIETTPWTKQGPQSKKGDAAKIGGGAALGAIIGAIAGGGRGAAIGAGAGGAAGNGSSINDAR